MFKGILPVKRPLAVDDITLDVPSRPSGKENRPHRRIASKVLFTASQQPPAAKKPHTEAPQSEERERQGETVATNQAFERMLDDLQIPSTLRPRLDTLESPVKAAMVRSSHFLTLTGTTPSATRTLRRARSIESLDSPRKYSLDTPEQSSVSASATGSGFRPGMRASQSTPEEFPTHTRTISVDLLPRSTSQPLGAMSALSKPSKEKEKGLAKDGTPERLCQILATTSSMTIDVETLKKLRIFLRNEAAEWTEAFLAHAGYAALLSRLREILEVEWREEQHDDRCLHELLRCFKALSTSAVGCDALRSECPEPFIPLVRLLFSEKKPGDLCTRQLIVELLLIIFDLYPTTISPAQLFTRGEISPWHRERESFSPAALPSPYTAIFPLIRDILLTPAPPPVEQPRIPVEPHAFIESLHVSRIYKTYLQELSDVCRDYFWVFCHPQNTIWILSETDEGKVERPKAPGGMTGGVEFEAMLYLTTHFRLLNTIAQAAQDLGLSPDNVLSAHRLHSDLFASGLERILATARKASTAYYGTLHLEIARYVSLATRSGATLSAGLLLLLGSPPSAMSKSGSRAAGTPRSSPRKARAPPMLPSPVRVGNIVF